MDWEQNIELVTVDVLPLKMLDWQRQGWEIVALAPASWQLRLAPSLTPGMLKTMVRTYEVRDYQIVLKRPKPKP